MVKFPIISDFASLVNALVSTLIAASKEIVKSSHLSFMHQMQTNPMHPKFLSHFGPLT